MGFGSRVRTFVRSYQKRDGTKVRSHNRQTTGQGSASLPPPPRRGPQERARLTKLEKEAEEATERFEKERAKTQDYEAEIAHRNDGKSARRFKHLNDGALRERRDQQHNRAQKALDQSREAWGRFNKADTGMKWDNNLQGYRKA